MTKPEVFGNLAKVKEGNCAKERRIWHIKGFVTSAELEELQRDYDNVFLHSNGELCMAEKE